PWSCENAESRSLTGLYGSAAKLRVRGGHAVTSPGAAIRHRRAAAPPASFCGSSTEREQSRARFTRHRLWPPSVFPIGKKTCQLRHDALGEHLGVITGQVFAHVAELQQQHQVPDVQVDGYLPELLRDFVRRTDNHVAAFHDVVHLPRKRLKLVLVSRWRSACSAL